MIYIKIIEKNVGFLREMKINKTLTKNMLHVKWKEIPPVKGPDSQGLNVPVKQAKTLENSRKINGRYRQSST
jgi:hypothetical protein